MSAKRSEGLELIREGDPAAARKKLAFVESYYANAIEKAAMNFNHLTNLLAAMATLKVWAEACLLAAPGDEDTIVRVDMALADVAQTEAIWAAYWEGVLEETRRQVGEQRAEAAAAAASAAVMAEGDEGAVASGGKSKAAKRKQLKRKAQQQKKRAAEEAAAAAAAGRAARDGAAMAGSGTSEQEEETAVNGGQEATGQKQQLQQDPGGLAAATLGLTLHEEKAGDEEKEEQEEVEEEECSVCLCVLLESEDSGCRLVCQHVYHVSCLTLWQANCLSKSIEPTCPYCRAPVQLQSEG